MADNPLEVKLLPCPCCASTDLVPPPKHWPEGCVYCRSCGLRAHSPGAWNCRVPDQMAGVDGEVTQAVAVERERCARLAEQYSEVNFERAGDSVLLDPCLRGRGFTPENVAESERQQINGLVHSSQAHAGQHIAAAIRRETQP